LTGTGMLALEFAALIISLTALRGYGAARRLLCRAALLRWMICLLTSESMIGTAWL